MSDVSNKQESPLKGDRGSKVVIELRDVRREFHVGSEVVKALRGVSFKIHEGEFVTIMGKSGSIFQNYNLLAKTTAVENVELPLMYNKTYNARQRREAAIKALQAVGLGDRLDHKSNQMSGGQMQRVAIARALVNNPAVILADEATGNLDTHTSFEILCLFQELHRQGRTIIFVTHNPEIAQYSSRNIMLRDGKICDDKENTNILDAQVALAALPSNNDE